MSDSEHSEDEGPSEAELALKKRRAEPKVSTGGLDEASRELLETNRQDRERMEQEIQELKKRNEKRKQQREIEEKRLAAERAAEDEKRKAAENAKQKQKEEEEMKRQKERAKKAAEFDKYKNAGKPNFVISKRSGSAGDEEEVSAESKEGGKKSREQLEAEKRAIMKQRIAALQIDGLDASGLADKAKELHKQIHRLEGEKYDLEKRFKSQQVDMMELAEKARRANKVGKDGLKRMQLGDGESDTIQERFAGTPAKIQMFSKYERQKDMRNYGDRKTIYTGPQYILPPERIAPHKIVKWNESGMPTYEDMPEGGHTEPVAVEG